MLPSAPRGHRVDLDEDLSSDEDAGGAAGLIPLLPAIDTLPSPEAAGSFDYILLSSDDDNDGACHTPADPFWLRTLATPPPRDLSPPREITTTRTSSPRLACEVQDIDCLPSVGFASSPRATCEATPRVSSPRPTCETWGEWHQPLLPTDHFTDSDVSFDPPTPG